MMGGGVEAWGMLGGVFSIFCSKSGSDSGTRSESGVGSGVDVGARLRSCFKAFNIVLVLVLVLVVCGQHGQSGIADSKSLAVSTGLF